MACHGRGGGGIILVTCVKLFEWGTMDLEKRIIAILGF